MRSTLAVDDVLDDASLSEIFRQWEASEYVTWALAFTPYHQGGRARLRLAVESVPDGSGLTALERELLDGLAKIIAADILRRREVAQC